MRYSLVRTSPAVLSLCYALADPDRPSGIVEQMGTVKGVQSDKEMVMWSGDVGKGEFWWTPSDKLNDE